MRLSSRLTVDGARPKAEAIVRSEAPQTGLERSLRVPPTSTTTVIVAVAKVGYHRCGSVSLGSTNDCLQNAWLSRSVTRLSANDPTSAPCLSRCNKSSSDIPSSTPPSLYLEIRCCAHRLNPQPIAAILVSFHGRKTSLVFEKCQVTAAYQLGRLVFIELHKLNRSARRVG